MKVACCGGTIRALGSEGGGGASCAAATVGVIGDTGGRLGEPDSERLWSRSRSRSRCSVVIEVEEVLEGDTGRALVVFVSTRSAGMAARWRQRGGGRDVLPVENRGPPKLWEVSTAPRCADRRAVEGHLDAAQPRV